MLLAYVDESYTATHYWIAALVCPEDTIAPLGQALDAVVEKAASTYQGISTRAELHGHRLFHGADDWAILKPMPRARIGVYNGALKAIGRSGSSIIIRGVHRKRLINRYTHPHHPHAVVLEHLLERVDEHAAVKNEHALVIADEVDQADQYRRALWFSQKYATSGYRSRQLSRVVDTLHFAPSEASRLVQAADLIAFMHTRITSGVDNDPRAVRANDALWARVAGNVTHSRCWCP